MPKLKSNLALKAKLFRGLADSSRLSILECLRKGPRNVGDIVKETGLTQSNASMHLECLYCCGLVEREKEGRFVNYSIRSQKTQQLLASAERALAEVVEHIESCRRYRG